MNKECSTHERIGRQSTPLQYFSSRKLTSSDPLVSKLEHDPDAIGCGKKLKSCKDRQRSLSMKSISKQSSIGSLSATASPRNVSPRRTTSKYGGVMSMPQLPLPALNDIDQATRPTTAPSPSKHNSGLLREIRSHRRDSVMIIPSVAARNNNSSSELLTDVLRDIRQARCSRRQSANDGEEEMVEFQLRCHARKRRERASPLNSSNNNILHNTSFTNFNTEEDVDDEEPRPFSPVKSQMRVLRSCSDRRAESSKHQDITVDFSPRKGSPRRILPDMMQVMEEMVGLTVLEEIVDESSSNDGEAVAKKDSLDVGLERMLCRIPLRRRNAIRRDVCQQLIE